MPRPRPRLAIALALVFIGTMTLAPAADGSAVPRALCLLCGARGLADVTLNVILFLPLGVALARGGAGIVPAVLVGLVVSVVIEGLQWYIPGRAPTLRDVAVNAFGTGVGAYARRHFAQWLRVTHAARLRLALAAAFPTLVVTATGILRVPYVAPVALWGQWQPDLGRLEVWSGTVRAATVGGLAVGGGPYPRPGALRAPLLRGDSIRVDAIAGSGVPGLAPVFAVADARSEHVLLIGQDHDDLVVLRFLRASQLRLDTPDSRVRGLFTGIVPGTPMTLVVWSASGRTCARLNAETRCTERASPMSVWSFFLWRNDAASIVVQSLLALSALVAFLPLGLFSSATPHRASVLAFAIAAVGVGAAAALTHLAMPGAAELLGAAAGSFLGRWIARHARERAAGEGPSACPASQGA